MKDFFVSRIKSDLGLMGHTHALSAVAMYLLVLSLYPELMLKILHTDDPFILFVSTLVVVGGATLPDLDNSQSTAISTFGIVGKIISNLMRGFAVIVYSLVKSKYDSSEPDPHRSFWHTILCSLFVCLVILGSTYIPNKIQIDIIKKEVTIGYLFAIFWLIISLRLAIAGLFGKLNKKIKKENLVSKIIILGIMILFSIGVIANTPSTIKYDWIAYSITLGYIIHILGDTLTKSGTPLLWPIKFKGKMWYTHRIIGIEAGGEIENLIFIPIFLVTIAFSIVKLVGYYQ